MCNLNTFSQLYRIAVGLVLIASAWVGPYTSIVGTEYIDLWAIGWLGLIPLLSGIAAFCPIYAVLGHDNQSK